MWQAWMHKSRGRQQKLMFYLSILFLDDTRLKSEIKCPEQVHRQSGECGDVWAQSRSKNGKDVTSSVDGRIERGTPTVLRETLCVWLLEAHCRWWGGKRPRERENHAAAFLAGSKWKLTPHRQHHHTHVATWKWGQFAAKLSCQLKEEDCLLCFFWISRPRTVKSQQTAELTIRNLTLKFSLRLD